jgi:hypothetical protein
VVAPDHDRRADLARAHELVEAQPGPVALAVAEPADARRQALVGDARARQLEPALQVLVLGEELSDRGIGGRDVVGIAGERGPAERAGAGAEERPHVGLDEARVVERVRVAAGPRLGAQAVAVVEDLGAAGLERHHRGAVAGHRGARELDVALGIARAQLGRVVERQAVGHVAAERIVGARLVGHDVGREAALEQLAEDLAGGPDEADRAAVARRARLLGLAQRGVEVGRHEVEVARLDAPLEPVRVDVHDEADAVEHRDRERLRAAHAAAAGRQHEAAAQRAAELLARDGGERLERALQDALRADVDPRAGRHLAVHRQPLGLEPPERLPVGPVGHEQAVRDQHARRHLVGAEDADGLPALHEQRLVVLEPAQRGDDRVERLPRARGAPGAAVDDEVRGILGDLRVEVVHEHAQGGFLEPALAAELGAARRADDGCVGHGA